MSEPNVIAAARAMLRGYYNCEPLPMLAEQLADALAEWRPAGETPIDGALLAETQRCLCDALAEIERLRAAHDGLLAVAQELAASAAYWSEYDVPLGIVARLDAAIERATGEMKCAMSVEQVPLIEHVGETTT